MEYVDVRELWPIYVKNQLAVKLEGKPRDISVEDAKAVAEELLGHRIR